MAEVGMGDVFRLEVGADRLATLTFDLPGKRVNVFTRAALAELEQVDRRGRRRGRTIGCLILLSGKTGNFIAGADVEEIARVTDPAGGAEAARAGPPPVRRLGGPPLPHRRRDPRRLHGGRHRAVARLDLAAWRATAARRASACPRCAWASSPRWGGLTRLPRLIGMPDGARPDPHRHARRRPPGPQARPRRRPAPRGRASSTCVRDFALARPAAERRRTRRRASAVSRSCCSESNPLGRKVVFDQARKQTRSRPAASYPAPLPPSRSCAWASRTAGAAGFAAEARAAGRARRLADRKNLVHVFRLAEGAKKPTGLPTGRAARGAARRRWSAPAIMGGGIAQLIAQQAGLPVRMKDVRAGGAGERHGARRGALRAPGEHHRRLEAPEARRTDGAAAPDARLRRLRAASTW